MADNSLQEGNSNPDESPDENVTDEPSETGEPRDLKLWPWSKPQKMTVEEYKGIIRSCVRPYVTYALLITYIVFSLGLIVWLVLGSTTKATVGADGSSAELVNNIAANKETILVVFTAFSTLVTSLVSYWFGSRGNSKT